MSWHTGPMVAFDLETTGVDTEQARIVTATVARIHGADVQARSWLVNPGVDIPQAATDVHGVSTERAQADGEDPARVLLMIRSALVGAWDAGHPVIIYNAPYDVTVLDRELRRHHGQGLDRTGPIIDPFVIDKALDRFRKGSRTLTAVCAHYGVRLDAAHDATEDALAAARLAYVMAQRHPELADLDQVNALQARWRGDWAVSFRAYLEKQGKPADDVKSDWPLVPFVPTPACHAAEAIA